MPIQQTIKTTKVPIKIWTDDIEDSALEQAKILADHMPIAGHLSLMPDVHLGMGMPIGGVLPLHNAISPNCVGVDIGCGVLAVKTNLQVVDTKVLGEILRDIRKLVPIGKRGRRKGDNRVAWSGFDEAPPIREVQQELKNARKQLGTLGGGNHFIEIQQGDDGHIWWMIHSGSRNIGFRVANAFHKLALKHGIVPEGNERLAYFPYGPGLDCNLGRAYEACMEFCLDFAYQNRLAMSNDVKEAFGRYLDYQVLEEINIHHNYATPYLLENGEEVILHRKGATKATRNTIGIIPGSQGSLSYIVKGKGEPESFQSCSHGAGRKYSRTMAKKILDVHECVATMHDMGLKCDAGRFHLDEAKEAYKDIEQVMANQNDLVEVLVELRPYKYPALKG